jgi:hypothetical protein
LLFIFFQEQKDQLQSKPAVESFIFRKNLLSFVFRLLFQVFYFFSYSIRHSRLLLISIEGVIQKTKNGYYKTCVAPIEPQLKNASLACHPSLAISPELPPSINIALKVPPAAPRKDPKSKPTDVDYRPQSLNQPSFNPRDQEDSDDDVLDDIQDTYVDDVMLVPNKELGRLKKNKNVDITPLPLRAPAKRGRENVPTTGVTTVATTNSSARKVDKELFTTVKIYISF